MEIQTLYNELAAQPTAEKARGILTRVLRMNLAGIQKFHAEKIMGKLAMMGSPAKTAEAVVETQEMLRSMAKLRGINVGPRSEAAQQSRNVANAARRAASNAFLARSRAAGAASSLNMSETMGGRSKTRRRSKKSRKGKSRKH